MLAEEQASELFSPTQLVERIQAGEREAESELVKHYWRGLFHVLNHRAKAPDLAADIAQDTFVVVINKARNGEIENPAALTSFVRQVGINLLIAHYRKGQRHKTDCHENIAATAEDQQADISTSLNSKQVTELVRQVMDELPTQRDRELLYRYFVYGQEKKVICREFAMNPEHFDRVLYRARNRLKQVIQVKLGVDPTQISISHLLGVVLASGLIIFSEQINANWVGGFPPVLHSSNTFQLLENAVRDRPRSMLEDKQHQQETRFI